MSSAPYCKHEDTTVQREKGSASDSTPSDESSEDDSDVGTLDGYSTTTVHTFLPRLPEHFHPSPRFNHGIVGEQQAAVSPLNSKKRTMNEYKSDRETKMALLVQKKAELDRASMSMSRLPLSSTFASAKKEQKNYSCTTCRKEINVDCKCLRRSLRLYADEEINEGLNLIIQELHEVRSHFKKTENIKQTRKKIKKISRIKKACYTSKGRLCYNCKLPSKEGCKCLKISTRIPFDVWANNNLTESDLKQKLFELFEIELRKKKEGNAKSEAR
jgi:hypothetical protein